MGLFDFIGGQFIEVIEWLDPTNTTLVYRFDQTSNNEIKQGAKLIVRPGQTAVFVNEGHLADIFETGTHELFTRNLPILSKLKAWPYGFNSPFKAEVYFFSLRTFTDLKWGTATPITLRDPEFGPVRVRAYGSYAIQITDPARMLEHLVSTDGLFQVDEISNQIRNTIVSSFASWLGRSQIPVLDLAAQYQDLGLTIKEGIQGDLKLYGLQLTQLLIENISLPPEVEQALDKRTSMGILGNMQQYTQFQAANAIEAAAQNPGGGGQALNWGMGMAMGQQMMNAIQQPPQPPPPPVTPPPPPVSAVWYLTHEGQTTGPLTLEHLLQQGISGETLLWKSGMASWQKAADLAEVSAHLQTRSQSSAQWYYSHDGQSVGPLPLHQLVQQGISLQTLVWREGMANWLPVSEVSEIASQLGGTPPPPPR